ncbi:MAG TPA: biotin--[acetyl-CoA-carboxylase] ligase [Blastocatellia bacterium]|nr:biotin--[acetyl-CoA-carboxylase] ligase [Blastocatellia bacterium]
MATLGSTVLRFEQLPSTSDLAREMAALGAEEGIAITARGQTAGRGRLGRAWSSPPGEGLYLSLILRPRIKPDTSAVITLAAAVAVAETLILDFDLQVDIKWPNDVLASGRKLCGILVESAIEKDTLLYAVMGIGVNLAQREFPDELRDSATSILMESGKLVAADDLLEPLLERIEHWYRMAVSNPDAVISRWSELSSYAHDCSVTIETPVGPVDGLTRGLTARGALIVETGTQRHEIISGEVKLRTVVSSP